jgi:hypothetical protein
VKSEAILAEEGRNLSERRGLEVLLGRVCGIDEDYVEVDIVGLCNSKDGCGAGVGLKRARKRLVSQRRFKKA